MSSFSRKNIKRGPDADDSNPDCRLKKRKLRSGTACLQGMVIAVSTLREGGHAGAQASPAPEISYRSVTEVCKNLGATISSQVHKRVKCVLCSKEAAAQATQRVRKAQRRKIPLVAIEWLFKCRDNRKKLAFDGFILDYPEAKASDPDALTTENAADDKSIDGEVPETGWSSPVDVGCCCVCHENGSTATCTWCTDCK